MLNAKLTLIDRLGVFQRIRKDIEEMSTAFVKVGFPQEAKAGDATKKGSHEPLATISEVAQVAAFHEFGTKTIPSRPFFRQALDTNKEGLGIRIKKEYDEVLLGYRNVHDGLSRIGEWLAAKIKRTITTGDFKPLSPVTIANKGSTKPLIDSGQMRQSVTYIVSTGAGQI